MSTTVIDSFLISLGIRPDTKGLKEMRGQVEATKASMLSIGGAIKAFVGGFAVAGIAKINSEFESNRIAIAGFLSALGVSSDFNKGLEDASTTIDSITKAAALLPGEAEEYVEVFKAGLPFLVKAIPGGDLGAITEFTNQFTAIGKTLGVDAAQIGRDLGLMLGTTGRAGSHVKTFQQMIPFMRQLKGQANLTAQSFNAMTQEKRAQLLQDSFVKLQPMLEASANSFDAMFGAVKSTAKQLIRMVTPTIFKAMKDALAALNAQFFTTDGKLTEFGKSFVETGKQVADWVAQIGKAVFWLAKLTMGSTASKIAIGLLVASMIGFKKILTGGLIGAIALIIEDLYQFYTGGLSVTGLLVKKFAPAIYLIEAALGVLMAAMARTQLVAVATGIRMAIAWLVGLGPIGLTLLAIAAVIAAAYLLRDKWQLVINKMGELWDGFIAKLKKIPHDIGVALGISGTSDEQEATSRARAAGMKARDEAMMSGKSLAEQQAAQMKAEAEARKAFMATIPSGIAPMATMTGADAMAGKSVSNSTSSSQTNNVTVNIQSTDPQAAGRETERVLQRIIRNGQSAVAM